MRDSIQEQVEQYEEKYGLDDMVLDDFHALLRAFMEECCEKAGEPLLSAQRLAIRFRIEDHFAWLLRGE